VFVVSIDPATPLRHGFPSFDMLWRAPTVSVMTNRPAMKPTDEKKPASFR
jgi:hypothetical protein